MHSSTILWRRLDRPGHESARLWREGSEWRLDGAAAFAHESQACQLTYRIVCDSAWRTLSAAVEGWLGDAAVQIEIVANANRRWLLNGTEQTPVAGCLDIDLNFSPSTNVLPIRRLALDVGAEALVRAAWLRFPSFTLEPLDQVYRRVAVATYCYESAGGRFVATLPVNEAGLVTEYPGFWTSAVAGPALVAPEAATQPGPARRPAVRIRRLQTDAEARACAQIMSTSEPWTTLGRTFDMVLGRITDPEREVWIAVTPADSAPEAIQDEPTASAAIVGFSVLCMTGAFTGYVQTLVVRADWRSRGLGSELLRSAEERIFRDSPNVFMCVSSFNPRARALYERLGYEYAGVLRDLIVPGHDEILLRKTTGPATGFKRT